ncbi:hypothetical protein ACQWU4_17760 [Chryseobacterium sp. MIQD13]|uniref:helix-turn-helix transcriptional regulator n=1 Tax=Chryseobacterium sp. MIQD13 TaxID=3422310 RepID=UPI003D2760A0
MATRTSVDSLWTLVNGKGIYAEKGSKEMLRLCTEIYYQSHNIDYEPGKLRALVKMSEIYSNEGNYKECFNKITEGLALAEKLENYITWSDLLLLQAGIYTDLGYFKKAENNFPKCLLIADKIPKSDNRHTIKSKIFRHIAYNIEKGSSGAQKLDSVEFYYHMAYMETKKLSDKFPDKNRYVAKNAKNIAAISIAQNKIPEADKYLNEFEILAKDEKPNSDYISFYILKGKIENKKKNYDKAIEYFNKSTDLLKEYKILPSKLVENYSGIAESYGEIKDYKNQAIYLAKAKDISDSLAMSNIKMTEKVGAAENEKKNKNKSYNIVYILIAAISVLLLLFLLFIWKNRRKKEDNISNGNDHEKLIASVANTKEIQKDEEKGKEADFKYLNDIIELAQNNDQSFLIKFLDVFPTFNKSLLTISTQLTPTDIEYCALIKLNFDTKQIATIKKTSIASVESRKYRIRKKLNISNSENIYIWMAKV